jgi:KDO2-lipid IV(A) lauroyltransferase
VKRLRYLLEYLGLRLALFLLDRLSLSSATGLAHGVADLWYAVHVPRRRMAVDNLLRSGIVQTRAEASKIARASFRHFAVLVVESLKSSDAFDETNWRNKVRLDISPAAMELLNKPSQGVILVSGHLGNWEVAAQLLSYLKPVVGITRDMNNPYTDRLIKERKPRNRFRLTPKHDAGAGRLLSILKNGEILALLIDQHARQQGVRINFFGVPASTHSSPALLHLVTGAPLCFGYCLRNGPMSYTLKALDPIVYRPTGHKEEDVRAILEKLNRLLENAIRQAPDQYLWGHRRWRNAT